MTHEELVQAAIEAINRIFADTSVSQDETARSLQSLIDEIEIMIDSLDVQE